MIALWLRAFVFTQVIECGIYAPLLEGPLARRLWIAFSASAITHPVVHFVIGELAPVWGRVPTTIVAELFAVSVEALHLCLLGRMSARRALTLSLLANGSSFLVGLFCYSYLDLF